MLHDQESQKSVEELQVGQILRLLKWAKVAQTSGYSLTGSQVDIHKRPVRGNRFEVHTNFWLPVQE